MRFLFSLLLLSMALPITVRSQERFVVSTVAGIRGESGATDGSLAVAKFNKPTWIDFDRKTGSLYVVDRMNNAIRRITGAAVTTIPIDTRTDLGFMPFDFDGGFGGGIAIEPPYAGCGAGAYAHGFFVASTGSHQIVFATDNDGWPQLAQRDDALAILGTRYGVGSSDGVQWEARFRNPTALALSWNYIGGSGTYQTDRLYIADTGNHTIREVRYRLSFEGCPQPYYVFTLAGSAGIAGSSDGEAHAARFDTPRGLAAAPDGSVYVADSANHTIRRIAADGTVTTVAGEPGVAGSNDGPSRSAHLNTPSGLQINAAGEVFIADTLNHTIRRLSQDGMLTTIAGVPGVPGFADGEAGTALFDGPVGLRLVGDDLYIADTSNHVIRVLSLRKSGRERPIRR